VEADPMAGSTAREAETAGAARHGEHRASDNTWPDQQAKLICADLLRSSSALHQAHRHRSTPGCDARRDHFGQSGRIYSSTAQASFDRIDSEMCGPLGAGRAQGIWVGHAAEIRIGYSPYVLAVLGVPTRVRVVRGKDRLAAERHDHTAGRIH